jgi:putative oxidoreductase
VSGADLDLAAFLLRVTLGVVLVVHGWNKVFGSGGLAGTTSWFAALGLRPAAVHARVAAASEVGAGTLMAAGLLTQAAALALVGLMAVATLTDHRGKGFFVFKGGWEYTVVVGAVAVSVAVIGPGAWSLDGVFGIDRAGWGWAPVVAGGGIVAALLLLAFSYRPEPGRNSS